MTPVTLSICIATLNRAMFRSYEYLVERGIIAPKSQKPPKEEYLLLTVDTEKLREQLGRDGYKVSATQGARWIAQLGDTKVVCPIGSTGQIKISSPQRAAFEQTYQSLLTSSSESISTPALPTLTPTRVTGLARIGLDESGKGDYFGPLVVGAVYVDESTEAKLIRMGVRDSKRVAEIVSWSWLKKSNCYARTPLYPLGRNVTTSCMTKSRT